MVRKRSQYCSSCRCSCLAVHAFGFPALLKRDINASTDNNGTGAYRLASKCTCHAFIIFRFSTTYQTEENIKEWPILHTLSLWRHLRLTSCGFFLPHAWHHVSRAMWFGRVSRASVPSRPTEGDVLCVWRAACLFYVAAPPHYVCVMCWPVGEELIPSDIGSLEYGPRGCVSPVLCACLAGCLCVLMWAGL